MLPQLCSVKRTGPGVPVLPLMISVLLLLWTLAACRGLWRGRYVDLIICPLTWFLCVFLFVSLLSGGRGRLPCVSFKSRAETESRNAAAWLQTPCSSLLLLFFFCMNAPCQLTREIKMVVCISCRVAVALPAFPSRLMFLVWGSHKIKAFFLKI